jgi:hypothetical protein
MMLYKETIKKWKILWRSRIVPGGKRTLRRARSYDMKNYIIL